MLKAYKHKFHYIYKITRADGKYYIGLHSSSNLDDGYFGSGQLLWKSIKKHGKEKHTKEILEFLPSRAELKIRERELVNEEALRDPMCMNLTLGGQCKDFVSDDERLRISKAKTGRKLSAEHKEKLRIAALTMSDEVKAKIGLGTKKRFLAETTRISHGERIKGGMSDEVRAKMSNSAKKANTEN